MGAEEVHFSASLQQPGQILQIFPIQRVVFTLTVDVCEDNDFMNVCVTSMGGTELLSLRVDAYEPFSWLRQQIAAELSQHVWNLECVRSDGTQLGTTSDSGCIDSLVVVFGLKTVDEVTIELAKRDVRKSATAIAK